MIKRRFFIFLSSLCFVAPFAFAEPAFVYTSTVTVLSGEHTWGTVANNYVIVSAKSLNAATAASTKFVIGLFNGDLKEASLARIDNELDAAVLKMGNAVTAENMIAAHKPRAVSLQDFLPKDVAQLLTSTAPAKALAAAPTELYEIRINGAAVTNDAITLEKRNKQANCEFQVVRLSSPAIWRLDVTIESVPELYFWNREKQKGLDSAPAHKLRVSRQAFFSGFRPGDKMTIPLEISSIKNESAIWTVRIESKGETFEKKINVNFK